MGLPQWNAELGVNGVWLSIEECKKINIELVAASRKNGDHMEYQMGCINRGEESFRLDGFRWVYSGCDDSFGKCGKDLAVYLEGWTMASFCGTKRFGDCDFNSDPGYTKFCVSNPDEYHPGEPNKFRSDIVTAVRDASMNKIILAGFVTSADQYGRFTVEFSENGIKEWNAISSCDGIVVDKDEVVSSEVLAVFEGFDLYHMQCNFADIWGKRMKARTEAELPLGWCSWYYYFSQVTEEDVMTNTKFLAANRDKFPVKYIQLDDGYEPALGDWLDYDPKFPNGLAKLAENIRKEGFTPALWVGPFMGFENSRLIQEHPEYFIHDKDGNIIKAMGWRGGMTSALDGTNPATCEFLKDLFRKIRAMGFDYVKLDFMMLSAGIPGESVYFDPKATRAQALRRGLAAIREGFGEDGFILGCTTPLGPVVGLVDGERIGTDIAKGWESRPGSYDEGLTMPNVCRNIINRSYMHRRLWLSDPDTLLIRKEGTTFTEEEAKLWFEALRLAGGLLLSGDRLDTLEPERLAWTIELFSNPDAYEVRALDVWERSVPGVWLAINRKSGELRLTLFNFENEEVTFELEQYELPRFCSDTDGSDLPGRITLPPHCCRVFNEVF
ncbi:MAG: alpha-galactosidase [Lentisphaeria bacterium]|nr:alpha-galactosidase [Lentisphaeria bacterium]MBO5990301.1 alpha-galactosidase [Lentisphaeria bacterium]MBO7153858.1 alpha-galactosidase [Lentisphaeria bacterium]